MVSFSIAVINLKLNISVDYYKQSLMQHFYRMKQDSDVLGTYCWNIVELVIA